MIKKQNPRRILALMLTLCMAVAFIPAMTGLEATAIGLPREEANPRIGDSQSEGWENLQISLDTANGIGTGGGEIKIGEVTGEEEKTIVTIVPADQNPAIIKYYESAGTHMIGFNVTVPDDFTFLANVTRILKDSAENVIPDRWDANIAGVGNTTEGGREEINYNYDRLLSAGAINFTKGGIIHLYVRPEIARIWEYTLTWKNKEDDEETLTETIVIDMTDSGLRLEKNNYTNSLTVSNKTLNTTKKVSSNYFDNYKFDAGYGGWASTNNTDTATKWLAMKKNASAHFTVDYTAALSEAFKPVLAYKIEADNGGNADTAKLLIYDNTDDDDSYVGCIWDVLNNKSFVDETSEQSNSEHFAALDDGAYSGYWGPVGGRNLSSSNSFFGGFPGYKAASPKTYLDETTYYFFAENYGTYIITVALLDVSGNKEELLEETITITVSDPTPPAPTFPINPGTGNPTVSEDTPASNNSGSGGGGSGTTSATENNNSNESKVIIDGKSVEAGTTVIKGSATTLIINETVLHGQIATATNGITVVIPSGTDVAEAQLGLNNIGDMADKNMTFSVQVGNVLYEVPTSAIDVAAVMENFDTDDASKVTFNVTIKTTVDAKTAENAAAAVVNADGQLVLDPLSFTITATYDGKTVELNDFGGYVARTIEVSAEDAAKITTAVVVEANGVLRPVPTNVYQKNGKWYVTINSVTNSVYALINYEKTFTDVKGKWYEKSAAELANRKIIEGMTETTFGGDSAVTRAMFCTIMVRALGLSEKGNKSSFKDVSSSEWYYGAVSTAVKYGIIEGRGDEKFDPNSNITWQEAMVMIQRAAKIAGYKGRSTDVSNYADSGEISDWALDGAKFIVGSSLISSNSNGTNLNPQKDITRAETADIVLKLLQKANLINVKK